MLNLICRLVAMLGSLVRTLVMCIMIQKTGVRGAKQARVHAEQVHVHFNHMYIRHACFVCQVRLGRS